MTHETNHTSSATYTDELAEELQLRDVPQDAIDRIVLETISHLADSGEDPREAFGSPASYADAFAPRTFSRRMLFPLVLLAAALGFGGGLMLINGILGTLSSSVQLWGLGPAARVSIGIALLVGLGALLSVMAVRSRRRSATWRV
ncbi:hypothetical protein ACFWHR_12450 [Leucobacter sp. NPDC058333]|uniref:hypothetical protein n=1 Tax=Leucobacter sp. NPDC058333 TaxID=3346450 RepID=UPI00365DD3AA